MSNIFEIMKAVEEAKQFLIAAGITEEMQQERDDSKYLMEYFNSYPLPEGRKAGVKMFWDLAVDQSRTQQSNDEVIG